MSASAAPFKQARCPIERRLIALLAPQQQAGLIFCEAAADPAQAARASAELVFDRSEAPGRAVLAPRTLEAARGSDKNSRGVGPRSCAPFVVAGEDLVAARARYVSERPSQAPIVLVLGRIIGWLYARVHADAGYSPHRCKATGGSGFACLERDHVAHFGAPFDDRLDAIAPSRERGALLGRIWSLVDGDDAPARARDMIEDGFSHFEPHAELLQPGGARPTQIVQRPIRDAARFVEGGLGEGVAVEGAGPPRPGKTRARRWSVAGRR